jgi:hypothetical protein
MPDITDIMDVNIEDLSPEQRQQLQDAMDQFQQKCLLSFKKNRSGVPYLKNEMPRVLLPGESDATPQQEKEECMQAFRESADYMLSKHYKAFLGAPADDGGRLWPRHGTSVQQGTCPRGHRGAGRVKLSTTVTEPATSASSSELGKSSFPAPSAGCWGSASSAPTTGLRRAANPATTAGQHGSTCATAESVPAYVRRASIRLAWSPTCLRPQDCSGEQLAAEELIRQRIP